MIVSSTKSYLSAFLLLIGGLLSGQSSILYPFEDELSYSKTGGYVSVSSWKYKTGSQTRTPKIEVFSKKTWMYSSGSWHKAYEDAKYFFATVAPRTYEALYLDSLCFTLYTTGTGPDSLAIEIGSHVFKHAIVPSEIHTLTVPLDFYVAEQTELRIKGWGDTGSGSGKLRIDSLQLFYTPIKQHRERIELAYPLLVQTQNQFPLQGIFYTLHDTVATTTQAVTSVSVGDFREAKNAVAGVFTSTPSISLKGDPELVVRSETLTSVGRVTVRDYFDTIPVRSGFVNMNHWLLSGDTIRHNPISKIGGSDSLFFNAPINFEDSSYYYKFTLIADGWKPYNLNNFWWIIMADTASFDHFSGLALTLYNGLWRLYRYEQGSRKELVNTFLEWKEAGGIYDVETLTTKKSVQLKITSKETGEVSQHIVPYVSNTLHETNYAGFYYRYIEKYAGKVQIASLERIITSSPFRLEKSIYQDEHIQLTFSSEIDLSTKLSQFNLLDRAKNKVPIQDISIEGKQVLLNVPIHSVGHYQLQINSVKSLSREFVYSADSVHVLSTNNWGLGTVLITEIMATPDREITLYDYEYVELFNTSKDTAYLKGWSLKTRYTDVLPEINIPPQSYYVICFDTKKTEKVFPSHNISRRYTLTNSGLSIQLIDELGALVDEMTYDESMYGKDKYLGYSLEAIDPQLQCNKYSNWKSSESESGGSPGEHNSISYLTPDQNPPSFLEAWYDGDSLWLLPSKLLHSSMFNGRRLGLSDYEPTAVQQHHQTITMKFDKALPKYHFSWQIDTLTDDCRNSAYDVEVKALSIRPPVGAIKISEVLWEGYSTNALFVELYNDSDNPIELSQLRLSRQYSTHVENIPLTTEPFSLPPQTYLAIAKDTLDLSLYYEVGNLYFHKNFPSLNAQETEISILDKDSAVIESIVYSTELHKDLLITTQGVSLERISFSADGKQKSNWGSGSMLKNGATPGYDNTNTLSEGEKIVFSSTAINPRNVNSEKHNLTITYQFRDGNYSLEAHVLTKEGSLVKEIASVASVGTQGSVTWDGTDYQEHILPPGFYIIVLSFYKDGQAPQIHREVCVVL